MAVTADGWISFAGVVGVGVVGVLAESARRRSARHEGQVTRLGDALKGQIEDVDDKVDRLDTKVDDARERLANVEGRVGSPVRPLRDVFATFHDRPSDSRGR